MDNASRPQPKKDAIPSQEDYAKLLLLLPTWILQATMSGDKPIFDVERNLKLFLSRRWEALHTKAPTPIPRSAVSAKEHTHNIAESRVRQGHLSDAFKVLRRENTATICKNPKQTLLDLMQTGDAVALPPADTDKQQLAAKLMDDDGLNAVKSTKRGRSPGPFGMTTDPWAAEYDHLAYPMAVFGIELSW